MTTDQNYQQIYRVGGMLDAGFVGQITYTISLDQVYDELDIHFSFDKRLYSESDVTPELIDRLQTLCTAKYDAPTYPVEEFRQTILHEMKTEIHTMAELNDNFIGCIHRQLTDRHMLYTKEFTSDGCLAQDTFSGVLKVTVLVFNVLLDNTQYTLTVSGHPVGQGVIAPNFNLMDTVKTAAGNAGASNAAGSADNSCDAESGSLPPLLPRLAVRASPALALLPRLAIRAQLAVLLLVIPSLHPPASNALSCTTTRSNPTAA